MLTQFFIFYTALKGLFFPLHKDIKQNGFEKVKVKVERIAKLDTVVAESSGLILLKDTTLLTMNDGGNAAEIYQVNLEGDLIQTIKLSVKNHDWEDLAQDKDGNIYVGDFGNNGHRRKNLRIWKTNALFENKEKIKFSYEDQSEFPPLDKKDKRFDCEAMVWQNDSLYLFSKNWGEKTMRVYGLPDEKGDYVTGPIDSLFLKGMITGADISDDGTQLVLLSYGFIYWFDVSEGINLNHPLYIGYSGYLGQSEAVVFLDKRTLLVTNEKGKLFKVTYK